MAKPINDRGNFSSTFSIKGKIKDLLEDILFYFVLILLLAESFYRRMRYESELYMLQIQEQMEMNNNYVVEDSVVHLENGEVEE